MAPSATASIPQGLPAWLIPTEVAAVLRLDPYTVRRMLREGRIPGAVKLPDRFWRIPRQSIEAMLGGQAGMELTDEQRDALAAMFTQQLARPRRPDRRPHSRRRPPKTKAAEQAAQQLPPNPGNPYTGIFKEPR
jgi:hypothetical protein